SLLIVTRWREERALGRDNASAIHAAMETAGRAVLLSGLTVGIGLLGLVILPVPGLRSVGLGGMLIPLVSVAVSLTLLPAMLAGAITFWVPLMIIAFLFGLSMDYEVFILSRIREE